MEDTVLGSIAITVSIRHGLKKTMIWIILVYNSLFI